MSRENEKWFQERKHGLTFFRKKVKFRYEPSKGSFARVSKPSIKQGTLEPTSSGFVSCREEFGSIFHKNVMLLYCHDKNALSYSIVSFIFRFEVECGATTTPMGPTQRPNIIWLTPSEWWTCCPCRKALLTILLRAGELYDPRNGSLRDAVMAESKGYGKITFNAIERFMQGNTVYKGKSFPGWVRKFQQYGPGNAGYPKPQIPLEQVLVKP